MEGWGKSRSENRRGGMAEEWRESQKKNGKDSGKDGWRVEVGTGVMEKGGRGK